MITLFEDVTFYRGCSGYRFVRREGILVVYEFQPQAGESWSTHEVLGRIWDRWLLQS